MVHCLPVIVVDDNDVDDDVDVDVEDDVDDDVGLLLVMFILLMLICS